VRNRRCQASIGTRIEDVVEQLEYVQAHVRAIRCRPRLASACREYIVKRRHRVGRSMTASRARHCSRTLPFTHPYLATSTANHVCTSQYRDHSQRHGIAVSQMASLLAPRVDAVRCDTRPATKSIRRTCICRCWRDVMACTKFPSSTTCTAVHLERCPGA